MFRVSSHLIQPLTSTLCFSSIFHFFFYLLCRTYERCLRVVSLSFGPFTLLGYNFIPVNTLSKPSTWRRDRVPPLHYNGYIQRRVNVVDWNLASPECLSQWTCLRSSTFVEPHNLCPRNVPNKNHGGKRLSRSGKDIRKEFMSL